VSDFSDWLKGSGNHGGGTSPPSPPPTSPSAIRELMSELDLALRGAAQEERLQIAATLLARVSEMTLACLGAPPPQPREELLSIKQAAERSGLSAQYLHQQHQKGHLEDITYRIGGRVLLSASGLARWIEDGKWLKVREHLRSLAQQAGRAMGPGDGTGRPRKAR
jgi:hypothetical protein